MGRKRDRTDTEKTKIIKCLSEGCSTIETSKMLSCDNCTIKQFINESRQGHKKHLEKKSCKVTA